MKTSTALSFFVVVLFLAGAAYSQALTKDDAPTFYRWTPGTYVNGWPRFTIHYPKDWVERRAAPQEIFDASTPGHWSSPEFTTFVDATPSAVPTTPPRPSLDKWADASASFLKNVATDVTITYDKPSQLRDGTPAREFGIRFFMNGATTWSMNLVTRKAGLYINMIVLAPSERIAEDLGKAILYSIEFWPDKDKPVKVPSDVQEFLDGTSSAYVAHDIPRLMTYYSDKYLNSGRTKRERELFYRDVFGSITSFEIVITDFVPAGDRAYLTGFATTNFGPVPITDTSIIKENGEWKWYGNQTNPPTVQ